MIDKIKNVVEDMYEDESKTFTSKHSNSVKFIRKKTIVKILLKI